MKRRLMAALLLSCCLTLLVRAQETAGARPEAGAKPEAQSETGALNGAQFRIDIPAEWNRVLVLYCHGYLPAAVPPNVKDPRINLLRNAFTSRGYAFALSAYSVQGWAVKEAMEDTEALRRYFVSKYGQPRESYIMGHSMGAVVTLATMERYPEVYAGGMPLCGPLSPILSGFQERIFDMLAAFEFFFPGTIGPLVNLPKDAKLDPAKLKEAIGAASETANLFARRYSLPSGNELPNVLVFYYEINRELQLRCGGNPFDNRNVVYDGFSDDAALNRGIKRYTADPKAREYLRQYYTPTGRISDPILTLQTTYDPLVPGRYATQYDAITKLAGTQDLFVAKFVVNRGHCNFTLPQTTSAFEQLVDWVRGGKRPEPGELK
ncbi:MAG TPA: alpha/beta hydrolase [Blastocatellia bacterium]|nr:alpha/beta hydrolase [Blastocatellia bacterium]